MAALAADRNTPRSEGEFMSVSVAAAVLIYAGALVARPAAGHAAPATEAANLVALGRAEERVDNRRGADGAVRCRVRRGTFRWANSANADEIAAADIGGDAWIVDDQTVAKTHNSNARSKAGRIVHVDAEGVWVETR